MECKYCGNESMLEMCNDCKNKDLINNCINAIYKDVKWYKEGLGHYDNEGFIIWHFANKWLRLKGLKFNDRKKLKRSIINKYKEVYNEDN